MPGLTISQVEWGVFEGLRPRAAGSNARLGDHGLIVRVPIARLTTESGVSGFGFCRLSSDAAERLLGQPLDQLATVDRGISAAGIAIEYPLWDLLGQLSGLPVYALTAALTGKKSPAGSYQVRCYDTSLYFDDLHLADDAAATALIADEAQQGFERGHRAFKIKVGRGARHMPAEAGTRRDIAIIQAVRERVGQALPIMIDANNGYTLNTAKHVLEATADCRVFWLEEAFHEDDILYDDLRSWMQGRDIQTLIADGEGAAHPRLLDWAKRGTVDIIQYDIFSYGFAPWLVLGPQLDSWDRRSAPHHYGCFYGNYAACHLASAIQNFAFVEWDEVSVPGIDTSSYSIADGLVSVPPSPGFGLALDTDRFAQVVAETGYRVSSK